MLLTAWRTMVASVSGSGAVMATWEAFWSKETVQPGVTYVAQKTISSFSPAPLTVYPILTVAPGVGQVSRGSAGEYKEDERAGVAWLSWRVSGR